MAKTESRVIGTPVLRKEDPELLTGQAKYTDDLTAQGMLWMHVVRSPYAHARIGRVDVSKALAMPGVVAAFSGQDLADWTGPLLMAWPVTEDINNPPHWPLAKDKARYQGDGVAVVVAESRAQAADAAEVVEIDYESLPVAVDMEAALASGAPLVHEEFGTNKSYTWTLTNGDVDKVFSEAPIVVKQRNVIRRLIANAIEPRSVLVEPIPATGRFTLWSSTQIPHVLRTAMALATGIPESRLRIVAPRVGGGFGSKLQVYPEEALALELARRLGRPIKWTETRSEGYLATHHGRDQIQEMELAADEDGKIRGYRARVLANMGAYLRIIAPGTPVLGAFLFCGCYGGEAYQIEISGVFTNTTPVDAYRGAGRPESAYAIEHAMDALAKRVGKDPMEIRRMNFMPPFTEPTPSIGGLTIDSGNYPATLDRALDLVGYEQLRKEQQVRREQGDRRQLGIGFSTYLENCGWGPSRIIGGVLKYAGGGWEAATIRCHPTGKVVVVTGTTPHGQGGQTTLAQVVADDLGVPIDDVEVLFGDTDISPSGWDTYGSRSAAVGTPAVHQAAKKIVDKARKIAAHELEVAEEDLEYEAGTFTVKGAPDQTKTMASLAFSLRGRGGYGNRGRRNREVRGGRRRGNDHQSSDRGGSSDGWGPPRDRRGALRGGHLRRERHPPHELHDELLDPRSYRGTPRDVGQPRDPIDDQRTGDQGRWRDGDHRITPGRDERRRRCPFAPWGHRRRAARHAGTRVEGHPTGNRRCGMIPAPFDYARAESVDHAIELLSDNDEAKIIAGGHSLLPLMRLRLARPAMLVDISRIGDLGYIREDGSQVAIGALARHHDVANSDALRELAPIVAYAASLIGDPQVRHVGTIGGSCAHADPASDMPTVLLALGADLTIRGPKGKSRTVTAADFFKGLFQPDLTSNEVLAEIRVPKTTGRGWSYLKFHRRAQDWAMVGVAALAGDGAGPAVALTNMGERPLRAGGVEQALAGGADPATAAQRADEGTSPPSDTFGSAEYRRELSKVLVRRALEEAMSR